MHLHRWLRPHARAGGPRETQVDRRPCRLSAGDRIHAGDDSDLGTYLGPFPRPELETRNLDGTVRMSGRSQDSESEHRWSLAVAPLQHVVGAFDDLLRGQPVLAQKFLRLSALAEDVLDPDPPDRRRLLPGGPQGPGPPDPVDDRVFLGRHDAARLPGRSIDRLQVKGLRRREVDHPRGDPLPLQHLRGLEASRNHDAAANQGHIEPVPEDARLPDREAVFDGRNRWHVRAGEPTVDRALHRCGGVHAPRGFRRVRGDEDRHPRDPAHERDVLVDLVGGPVRPDGQACVRTEDLHIQVRVRNVLPDHVVRVRAPEHAIGRRERDLSRGREPSRDADHVRLRDPELEQSVWEGLAEFDRLDRFRRVGANDDHVRVATTEAHEGFREVRPLALLLPRGRGQNATSIASSSARASFNSSSLVAAPWYLILFSMNETPFPLTVRAMTAVGRPRVRWASSIAAKIWRKSCPSIVRTYQLNASHFSASGSSGMMSSVRPSCWIPFRSMNAVRLSRPYFEAAMAASHVCPTSCSPSPRTQ